MSITTRPPELESLKGLSHAERETVAQIMSDLGGAAHCIQKAADRWIALAAKTREKVLDAAAPTWRPFLARLTEVGEGRLHPLLYSKIGFAARWLGRLPLTEQDKYLRGRIPVVHMDGRGRFDTRLVDVEEMSEEQRKQVFKANDDETVIVRDAAQQQAYLIDKKRRADRAEELKLGDLNVIKRPGRWRVEKGKLFPDRARVETGFTKRDISLMLRDLSVE